MMMLFQFHRVLIAAAILLDFFFSIWSVQRWRAQGNINDLYMAIGSSVVTLALIAYLVYFNHKLRRTPAP